MSLLSELQAVKTAVERNGAAIAGEETKIDALTQAIKDLTDGINKLAVAIQGEPIVGIDVQPGKPTSHP